VSEELPPGWAAVRLGDIITPRRDKVSPSSMGDAPFLGLEHVEAHTGRILGTGTVGAMKSAVARFQAGDTLYGRLRPYLNKVVTPRFEGGASAEFIVFPGGNGIIDADFLRMRLLSAEFVAFTATLDAGDRPRVDWDGISRFEFALPPLAEQRRIGARIGALFARTRQARADLLRIAPLAARYRERLRLKAFDGDLVSNADDKAGKPLDLPDYKPPARFENLPDIPSVWRWAEIGMVSAVAGGLTKNQQRTQQPIEIPYLRVANVYADELRLNAIETIRVSAAERERVTLEPGDLLVVEGNGSVEQIGRVAVWDGSIPGCGHQNHLIRVRPRTGLPSRYLLHWLMSPYGRDVLETIASSSSGLHTLSLSKVGAIPVPVPPPGIAATIAHSLDDSITASKRTEREATRALALLDHLEQAILAKAFRGELVPQDPNDEPAAVTLARARATGPTAPNGRRRRAA